MPEETTVISSSDLAMDAEIDFEVVPNGSSKALTPRCISSDTVAAPVDVVWKFIRDFTFPGKLLSDGVIESCDMVDNAAHTEVGAIRVVKWKSGEMQKHQLMALDDHKRYACWEIYHSTVPIEASAAVSSISARGVTSCKHTFIEWTTEFSSDVSGDLVSFTQKANQKTLSDMVAYFANNEPKSLVNDDAAAGGADSTQDNVEG